MLVNQETVTSESLLTHSLSLAPIVASAPLKSGKIGSGLVPTTCVRAIGQGA
ncbi:MAG TPA: hypothetical protein PLR18_01430 [bacterium]|nr:hypothetical protein [bacterium]